MNILIPMAGAGQRFIEQGYTKHKPVLPVTDRRTGKLLPMVVCATLDLPDVAPEGENVIFIDRTFHKQDGAESEICEYFPKSRFITIDHLTEGQACTCLMAKQFIDNNDELLIAGCDNGMLIDIDKFHQLKKDADCLVFTYRHDEAVVKNPNAYGWMLTDENENIIDLSIKKSISDTPMEDHAVVATFWFKTGEVFIQAAEKMINEGDRINGEFYVDEVVRHILELGYKAKVFEIQRYIGWGTPIDYENYMNTIEYWRKFTKDERNLAIE